MRIVVSNLFEGRFHRPAKIYYRVPALRQLDIAIRGVIGINLGLVYKRQQKDETAAAEYLLAIKIDRKNAVAFNNYGSLLHDQRNYAEAEKQIRIALTLNKNFAVAHGSLAEIYRDTNRREAAISEFKEALRLDPKLEEAQRELNEMNPSEATGAVQPPK